MPFFFFDTRKEPIEFIEKYNIRDERESAMMSSRWHTFDFTHQIENAKYVDPWTCCFSKLVLMGAEEYIKIFSPVCSVFIIQ